jgi:RimJ/RimL family protein N-acetyltransferase
LLPPSAKLYDVGDDRYAHALTTSRLRLVPATPALVDMELAHQDRLAEELDVDLPSDWPPAYHDPDRLDFTRKALEAPDAVGWWLHYIVLTDVTRPTLVGVAGYKGPPADGVVEIGYSIVASWQRRGLATEACRALIEAAWQRGAKVILAHTLPHLQPSIGVLRKLEFVPSQPQEPSVLAFALHRANRGALHTQLHTDAPRSSDDRSGRRCPPPDTPGFGR